MPYVTCDGAQQCKKFDSYYSNDLIGICVSCTAVQNVLLEFIRCALGGH